MNKTINTFCEGCDSEFEIKFNENLVADCEELYCPFCSSKIEDIDEEFIESDEFESEENWD